MNEKWRKKFIFQPNNHAALHFATFCLLANGLQLVSEFLGKNSWEKWNVFTPFFIHLTSFFTSTPKDVKFKIFRRWKFIYDKLHLQLNFNNPKVVCQLTITKMTAVNWIKCKKWALKDWKISAFECSEQGNKSMEIKFAKCILSHSH